MAVDFSNVLNTLETGVVNLAETELKDYVTQATQDGKAILTAMENNLETWTEQVTDGTLSVSDFNYQLLSQKDTLEMVALKQAGLAEIQADQFKDDVFNLIGSTIAALI